MIRTQIYLPEPLHKKLLKIKEVSRLSIASFIREAIEAKLGISDPTEESDILKLADLNITGGEADLSSNIDLHLYGQQKE